MLNVKNQAGFSILSISLVAAIVVMALGVWQLSADAKPHSGTVKSTLGYANNIIAEGIGYQASFDDIVIYHKYSYDHIVNEQLKNEKEGLDNNLRTNNVGNVDRSYMLENYSENVWIYNYSGVQVNDIGTEAPDPSVYLFGITDDVCSSINKSLHNVSDIPKLRNFSYDTISQQQKGISSSHIVIGNEYVTNKINITSWTRGCVKSSDDNLQGNLYFHVLIVK